MFALLGEQVAEELVLVDRNAELAEGEALDLLHATPFYKKTSIMAGPMAAIQGSDVVIISAGSAHHTDETRLSLASRNAHVIAGIAKEIARFAPDSLIIVVTNPVDVMAHVAWRFSGFPHQRVVGSGTVLDSARLRVLLAETCGISPANVHAYVIGEHGDSELAVWSTASLGGIPIGQCCSTCDFSRNCELMKQGLFEKTRHAGNEIIAMKGATNHAIAAATASIVKAIAGNEQRILTLSSLQDDVYIGYPVILGRAGVERTMPLRLSAGEQRQLDASKEILRGYVKKVLEELETK